MSPVKKFLLTLVAVYFVIALPIVILLGPPGFTSEFREAHQEEIDHYYEVIKDPVYKMWVQRPHIIESDPERFTPAFQGDLAFVQEFAESELFASEVRRRATFEVLFNILNAAMSIVLIVRFARQPLMDFIERQIAELRSRIEEAERARAESQAARAAAELQIGSLSAEAEVLAEQAHAAAQETVSALDSETASLMANIEHELELRKKIEVQRAAMRLKQELVEEAAMRVEQSLMDSQSDARQRLLVAQFLEGLEGASK